MARGTTVRLAFTLLSAVLLALQLLAPTASSASAHASPLSGPSHLTSSGTAPAYAGERTTAPDRRADTEEEIATVGDTDSPTSRTAPLRTRDRHRTTVDTPPHAPARALLAHGAPDPAPAVTASGSVRMSRSSTTRAPAALQVFRC
ncbi:MULTISPECIES: hypothetical protein [unclassified Streptomyces]|uniref:hypothetical protein n=1 Tax=unclassified Streptomyces TaxID=2593676 RepID=UPI0004BE9BE5|nr:MULTISPECIES: hypothetical protein [unclassified Streptomyces]